MSWATRHKILYFFIFIIVLAIVIGIPAYFVFYQAPTCTDGKKNGDEAGVDCGGSCVTLCRAEQRAPVVYWQQAFNVQGTTYSAVAYAQNPNPSAESFNAPYLFKIIDKEGQVIVERKGVAYIPAGRNFAVFESNIQIPSDRAYARTTFEFDEKNIVWLVARKNIPVLGTLNQLLTNASTSPSVDVDIQNPSLNPVGAVEVTAILHDANGNAFAASKTYLNGIGPRSAKHAVFTWPKPFATAASKIEIIPLVR